MGGSPFWRPSRWSSPCHGRIPPRQCPPHLHHWWMVHSLPWEVGWTLPFLFIAQLSLPCSSRRAPALRLKAAATRGRGSGGRVVRSRLSAAPPPPPSWRTEERGGGARPLLPPRPHRSFAVSPSSVGPFGGGVAPVDWRVRPLRPWQAVRPQLLQPSRCGQYSERQRGETPLMGLPAGPRGRPPPERFGPR